MLHIKKLLFCEFLLNCDDCQLIGNFLKNPNWFWKTTFIKNNIKIFTISCSDSQDEKSTLTLCQPNPFEIKIETIVYCKSMNTSEFKIENYSLNIILFANWKALGQLILATMGAISSGKGIFMLSYLLGKKWLNADFFFLLMTIYNFIFCLASIYLSRYFMQGDHLENYLEILIIGIINVSNGLLYPNGMVLSALEMWIATQMPLWHRIHFRKRQAILTSLFSFLIIMILQCIPEILEYGGGYYYKKDSLFITISIETQIIKIYYYTWISMVSLNCLIPIIFSGHIFYTMRHRDPIQTVQANQINIQKTQRMLKLILLQVSRFSLLWILGGFFAYFLKPYADLLFLAPYHLYLVCIGDGTLYIMLLPRYRNAKHEIIAKIAQKSKILQFVFALIIWCRFRTDVESAKPPYFFCKESLRTCKMGPKMLSFLSITIIKSSLMMKN